MPTAKPLDPRYLSLLERFPLRPIRSEKDYRTALAVASELVTSQRLRKPEADYLDVLADLIVKREEQEFPTPTGDEASVLRGLMDGNGLTARQLSQETGIANTTLSAVINGRRRLTREQVEALCRRFRVAPSAFMPAAK